MNGIKIGFMREEIVSKPDFKVPIEFQRTETRNEAFQGGSEKGRECPMCEMLEYGLVWVEASPDSLVIWPVQLPRALPWAYYLVVTILKSVLSFGQGILHFRFSLALKNYVTSLD